jgi:hypothetical protein
MLSEREHEVTRIGLGLEFGLRMGLRPGLMELNRE